MKFACICLLICAALLSSGSPAQENPAAATPAAAGTPEAATAPAAAPANDLNSLLAQLRDADYATKGDIVAALAKLPDPGVRPMLAALLEGNLYSRDADGQVLVAAEAEGLTRIGTNNSLRRRIRGAIAEIDLASNDATVRLAAVEEMLRSIDADSAALLRARLPQERDARVRERMVVAVASADLEDADAEVRLRAVESLDGNLSSEVFNRLSALTAVAEDGTTAEPDARVRAAAAEVLRGIQRWRTVYSSIETMFFGLSLGSVLVLAGIGLAITFGVMGVINMAHGELMMLGAYSVYVVQQLMPQHIGASILVAIPVAFLVSGLVGIAIERGIVRFLYGRPLETLLATFGVSLILQQVVRDLFSPNNRPVETPAWMAGSLQINEALSLTWTRLYIVLFAAIVFALLLLMLKRTRLGLEVRAVAQNRAMARAMGIRTEWVDALTFGLGSGIAGVAGVALSQLTNVGPNLGQSYIVDSFMVVVFGGVGSLWGTQISGTSLGVVSKLLEPGVGAVLAKIIVLVGLILFIQRRPRGLFPQKGRSAEA
jgi:urea transport system permease protein